MKKIISVLAALALTGCAASSELVKTVVLPTSNKSIDVVQHRSSIKFLDCGTLVVLQTYSADGTLIDSKDARGEALHCGAITAGIQSGGMVGAAHALRPSRTNVDTNNSNSVEQSQGQGQTQSAVSSSVSAATAASVSNSAANASNVNKNVSHNTNVNTNSAKGGNVKGHEIGGGSEKPHGNNGKGNGGNDGSPNGKNDSDR